MPEWLSNLFSLSKEISSKVALPIFIATCMLLFLPTTYSVTLGLDQFRDAYRIWIGVILLVSAAALITNALWALGRFIKPWVWAHAFVFTNKSSLYSLTNEEKAILRRFILDGEASVGAAVSSGPINLLERKNVVVRASNLAAFHTTFMYIMQPWARTYLSKRKHLLD